MSCPWGCLPETEHPNVIFQTPRKWYHRRLPRRVWHRRGYSEASRRSRTLGLPLAMWAVIFSPKAAMHHRCPAQKKQMTSTTRAILGALFIIQSKPSHLAVLRSTAGSAGCCHDLREPPLCPLLSLLRSMIFKVGRWYCIPIQTRCCCGCSSSSSTNMSSMVWGIRRGLGTTRCQVPHFVLPIEVDLKLASICLREDIADHGCDLHLRVRVNNVAPPDVNRVYMTACMEKTQTRGKQSRFSSARMLHLSGVHQHLRLHSRTLRSWGVFASTTAVTRIADVHLAYLHGSVRDGCDGRRPVAASRFHPLTMMYFGRRLVVCEEGHSGQRHLLEISADDCCRYRAGFLVGRRDYCRLISVFYFYPLSEKLKIAVSLRTWRLFAYAMYIVHTLADAGNPEYNKSSISMHQAVFEIASLWRHCSILLCSAPPQNEIRIHTKLRSLPTACPTIKPPWLSYDKNGAPLTLPPPTSRPVCTHYS